MALRDLRLCDRRLRRHRRGVRVGRDADVAAVRGGGLDEDEALGLPTHSDPFSREVLPLLSANAKLWENEGAEICETVPAFSSLVSRPGEGWSKSPGQSRRRSLLDVHLTVGTAKRSREARGVARGVVVVHPRRRASQQGEIPGTLGAETDTDSRIWRRLPAPLPFAQVQQPHVVTCELVLLEAGVDGKAIDAHA